MGNRLEDPFLCLICRNPIIEDNDLHLCSVCTEETLANVKEKVKNRKKDIGTKKRLKFNIKQLRK